MTNEEIINDIRSFDPSLSNEQILGLGMIVLSAYFKGKQEALTK